MDRDGGLGWRRVSAFGWDVIQHWCMGSGLSGAQWLRDTHKMVLQTCRGDARWDGHDMGKDGWSNVSGRQNMFERFVRRAISLLAHLIGFHCPRVGRGPGTSAASSDRAT